MGTMKGTKIWSIVLGTYLLCYVFRILEYFILRTDQTWVGEAIVHKAMGIVILFGVSTWGKLTVTQMGFVKEKVFSNLIKGLVFGCSIFVLAYGIEIMIAVAQGSFHSLQLYVSTYAISQNTGYRTELFFFLNLYYRKYCKCSNGRRNIPWTFYESIGTKIFFCCIGNCCVGFLWSLAYDRSYSKLCG